MFEEDKQNLEDLISLSGKYSIPSITAYIFNTSLDLNLKFSINRTQILLYYLESRYIYEKKEALFTENFIASNKGPFIPESIDWIKKALSVNKNIKFSHNKISKEDQTFINEVIKTFQDISTDELIQKTKEEDPWKLTFKEDSIKTIPKILIFNFFNENPENTARLYGIFENLDDINIINQFISDYNSNNHSDNQLKKDFSYYIENSLKDSGLDSNNYYSINDVLGYVCDFLIYKEKAVTLKELQVILYYIQKMFLKYLNKICFNEFIYKDKDSVSIGNLPKIYAIDKKQVDDDIIKNKEYDFANMEREYIAEIVRIKILEKKANKDAYKKFNNKDLEVIDIVLNTLIKYPGFHLLNLVQNEASWEKTKLYNVITVKNLYYN